TIRVQPAKTTSIRHPASVVISVRDYSRHGGKKPALVVSIADPKDAHKAALRVVVFSHLFPLRMDVG
ncbi:MAG: hypothetical protein WBQ43_09910, partial [Terriglobales bacterium]